MTAPELIEILSAMLDDGSILPHENLLIQVTASEKEHFRLEFVENSPFGPALGGIEI